ncbi:TonB-dependent receptor [Acetobacter garciniae]|uniref:TonB-dependent receptor n=2 Tax=Acetobacter garciniae TaxID=2817435 RepID=A0A939HKD5_9PROT|nr:TonB-dependent receptor [Acetobacter garciniae]MBO1325082.1 TonB-dependent receptor [Acetobacter garciniae]
MVYWHTSLRYRIVGLSAALLSGSIIGGLSPASPARAATTQPAAQVPTVTKKKIPATKGKENAAPPKEKVVQQATAKPRPGAADPMLAQGETIMVSARKRVERLERTPISITAFTGRQLDERGITSLARLQDFTPNMTFRNIPSNSGIANNASVYIRGIGQNDFSFGVDPGVGIYIDGVYIGSPVGSVFDLIDLQQVEVLKGPQGTLFGRNSIGGAINIHTVQPSEKYSAKADVKYGTANRVNGRAMVNIPLSKTLFLKLAAGTFEQDGYVNAPYQKNQRKLGNQDTRMFRAALRWHPVDAFNVTIAGDYMRDRSNGAPMVTTGIDLNAPGSMVALNNALAGGSLANCQAAGCVNSRYFSKNTYYGTSPTFSNNQAWSISATMTYDLTSALQLKSITAYRAVSGKFGIDTDGTPLNINQVYDNYKQRQFSEEFQVSGHAFNHRLEYAAGLYYYRNHGQDVNPIDFLVLSGLSGGYFNENSYAAYTQGTYHVTSKFSITAGARFTEDDKSFVPNQYITSTIGEPFYYEPPGTPFVPKQTYRNNSNKWTPMVNLAYQFNRQLMAYATFSQGFKGGGFTQRIADPAPYPPSFKPETVTSYEGGLKYLGLHNRLRLTAAGFYTFYNNMQLEVADSQHIGPYYTNAGRARIPGMELEGDYYIGDGWRVNAAVGLTDAHYSKLDGSVQGLTLASKLVLVSKWTVTGGVEKRFDLRENGNISPRVDVSYRSGYFTNFNGINYPELYQPGYVTVDFALRWHSANGHYSAIAGASNLSNYKFRTSGELNPSFGYIRQAFDRGRQWYVQGGVTF